MDKKIIQTMIKFFVRTTLDRKLDKSYEQIDYILLVDKEHKPVKSFINQLEEISNCDAVLLEDDLILCNNFKEKIEEVINNYPNNIINFFSRPTLYFKTHLDKDFSYNQCTYYPKGLARQIAKKMKEHNNGKLAYDFLESWALYDLKISHIIYRPCLVQHMDTDSLIETRHIPFKRISPWFVDYLEELGISYEEAWTKEAQAKLKELMNKKFKELNN